MTAPCVFALEANADRFLISTERTGCTVSERVSFWSAIIVVLALASPAFAAERIPVAFSFTPPMAANTVAVAGTFNDWNPTANLMTGPDEDGIWTAVIHLQPGRYEYKFVVDGKTWHHDPNAVEQVADPYGGKNSVVYVGVVPVAESSIAFDGWFESKLAKEAGEPLSLSGDAYLKFSGELRPCLETYTELHAWKSLSLGGDAGWHLMPPIDGLEVNQSVATFRLSDGIAAKLFYRGHAGNTKDPLTLIASEGSDNRIWDRRAAEILCFKGIVDGRIGAATLAGNKTLVYGEMEAGLTDRITLGGVATYERWATSAREDGEDHRANIGAYAVAKPTEALTVRGQLLQTHGTKIVSDSTVPVEVEFVYPAERESSGADVIYIVGSFNNWSTEDGLPLAKDADGNWRGSIELLEGEYEYKFWYPDPDNDPNWGHWMGQGTGGDNLVRHVGGDGPSFQDFYFVEPAEHQVYIRGSWDWSNDYELVRDPLTGYWKHTMRLDPGRYEYVFHYNDGSQDHWFGQGGDNVRFVAGAGGREVDYSALAYFAEASYQADRYGVTLGLKGAQDGVVASYGHVGADYRTVYGKAWAQAAEKIKLTLDTSYSTDAAGTKDSATLTVRPGLEILEPAQHVAFLKGSYEYRKGKGAGGVASLSTRIGSAGLAAEFAHAPLGPSSFKLSVANDFPYDLSAKAEYWKKLKTDDYSLTIEATKKIDWCDGTTIGVSCALPGRKLGAKLSVDF